MDRHFPYDFSALFPKRPPNFPEIFQQRGVQGLRVLITGAGGSIGSALARRVSEGGAKRVVLLDHSEQALFDLQNLGWPPEQCDLLLGDVRDESLLIKLLANELFDLIIHAAAFKHVPLLEENPFAAIQNNALATWKLARLAASNGVGKFLLISTDKAANPQNILGISKRLAELAILRWDTPVSRMLALRLGNVAWSSGSVLPIFQDQIARGGPVTVTHPQTTRYFLSMERTCAAIGILAASKSGSGIFLPEMGEPVSIHELAERMIGLSNRAGGPQIAVHFTGLRSGDKLREDLLSPNETLGEETAPGLKRILQEAVDSERWDKQFARLDAISAARDISALVKTLQTVAPEYRPGSALMKLSAVSAGGGHD